MPYDSIFSFDIYNEAGEAALLNREGQIYPAGNHSVRLVTENFSSGSYTLIVKSGNTFAITRFVILK